jgi:hypothetical protein
MHTEGGPPIAIPLALHLVLWPLLVVWACVLIRKRRRWTRLRSRRLSLGLALLAFFADAGALAGSLAWPAPTANSFILTLLWVAVLLSATAYLVLRVPDDGDDDDGGGGTERPEPPWWPDFERRFRDYSRGGPDAGRPRVPTSSG